jgi:4a-hydroxytetrahydrobiopterin dehydratase
MSRSPLPEAEVSTRLGSLPSWHREGNEIIRIFTLPDFRKALAFVNITGDLAEAAGHHPDIDIRYNKVRLALTTHDAGGLTANDFDLAAKINNI